MPSYTQFEGESTGPGSWAVALGDKVAVRRAEAEGTAVYPGKKTAGLLAYLALEGPTLRERLADLLWPDAASPRNSLRQALYALRSQTPVTRSEDPVALSHDVRIEFGTGELLSAFDYGDTPEFDAWLTYRREADRAERLERWVDQVEELEREGRLEDALDVARKALALDPLSEVAYRRIMRLSYLSGDRAGALEAFRRCKQALEQELGVQPLPETASLARDIERAEVDRGPERRRSIPVTVAAPPVLAGRASAWERMERAWAAGQVIYLSGEPGVGKTRLMHEFTASKVPRERWNVFSARPGDSTAPYASQARAFRAVLDACPGIELTAAMRHELSRLLPDYADAPPKPMTSLEEKNYFYATLAEVLILSGAWLDCWVADDWQFVDSASLEMANYMFANVTPVSTDRKGQRAICTFRPNEVGDDFRAFLADLVRGGIAVHIELDRLEGSAVERMLASTAVQGAEALAPSMHRFTGGNPLFVVETLKGMLEASGGELDPDTMQHTFPDRVAQIFDERFRRLRHRELRLLQVLAVAQTDASARLVGAVLGLKDDGVASICASLERARLITGFAFSHDLVYEAVQRATPAPVRSHLHRRTAQTLEGFGGPEARIAYHYEQSGDVERALLHLSAAAEEALVRGAFARAAEWFERVREHALDPDDVARAERRLEELAPLLGSR